MRYAVLTDNIYLYLGVKHSLSSSGCEHISLSGGDIFPEPVDKLTLFVDSRIFFSRIWSNFDRILSCIPHAHVLWLTHRSSCRYLLDDIGFQQEISIPDPYSFLHQVRFYLRRKEKRKISVAIDDFTSFDLKLLRCLMSGMTLDEISVDLKRSVKQVYAFRSKLSLKIGLRHAAYLSFHFDNISPYVFYLNLLIYKERRLEIAEKKDNEIKMEPVHLLSASGRSRKEWYPRALLD